MLLIWECFSPSGLGERQLETCPDPRGGSHLGFYLVGSDRAGSFWQTRQRPEVGATKLIRNECPLDPGMHKVYFGWTHCPQPQLTAQARITHRTRLGLPLPSELSPASPMGADFLSIVSFWVDSLPPSTVLGPKGHGHPVLPLQQMS